MAGKRGKRGGRSERLAQRAAKPAVDPCPPGQIGGAYKPLSESDLRRIYDTALDLLERLGIGEVPDRLHGDLLAIGAVDNGEGRVLFPPALVETAIDQAAKTFVLHGRDPDRSIEVGGNKVYFGTGGAAVQTLDIEDGSYRPSTLKDLHDFTRLQDKLANVSWFTRCCVATDLTDNFDLDVNTVFALLKHTTKPTATSFTLAEHVAPIVEMLDIAAGGPGEFAKRPFMKAHISPMISQCVMARTRWMWSMSASSITFQSPASPPLKPGRQRLLLWRVFWRNPWLRRWPVCSWCMPSSQATPWFFRIGPS